MRREPAQGPNGTHRQSIHSPLDSNERIYDSQWIISNTGAWAEGGEPSEPQVATAAAVGPRAVSRADGGMAPERGWLGGAGISNVERDRLLDHNEQYK